MPGLFSAALCASYLAVAGAAVLDLPIIVNNGYVSTRTE
jgi:hypothetical protein